jgi:ABC-type lipoprotein release transport system permease subunit
VNQLRLIAYLARLGTISRSRNTTLGLLVVLTLSSAALIAGQSLRSGGADDLDRAAIAAGRPDITLWGRRAALEKVSQQPGIARAGSMRPINGIEFETTGSTEFAIATVTPPPGDVVNLLHLISGRIPNDSDADKTSVAVEPGIATLGSSIRLSWLGTTRSYKVIGIVTDFSMCGRPACGVGRVFLNNAGYRQIYGPGDNTDASVSLMLTDPTKVFVADLPGITRNTPWTEVRPKLLAADDVIGTFVAGLGGFLFLGSLLVLFGIISSQMISRSREFAITATVGATSTQIGLAVMLEYLVLTVIASASGWIVGSFAAPLARVAVARSIGWGPVTLQVDQLTGVTIIMTIATILAIGTSVVRTTRRPLVSTLRNDAVAGTPRIDSFRFFGGGVVPCAVSEVASRRTRTVAGVFGIALAVAGIATSLQLRSTINVLSAPENRLGTQWDISAWPVTSATSETFAELIGEVPGQTGSFTSVQFAGKAFPGSISESAIRVNGQGGDVGSTAVNLISGRNMRAREKCCLLPAWHAVPT